MNKNTGEKLEMSNENTSNSEEFDYERFEAEEARYQAVKAETVNSPKPPKAKFSPAGEAYEWTQCLVSALLICVLVFAFFVRIIGIIGYSMVPTFDDGDSVIISNLFYQPEQGDIVVLRKQEFQDEPIIKRVIAVEGQTVDIDFDSGVVSVDDKPLSEPYTAEPTLTPLDFDGKITVPENCVFVMGDNRNHSTDSRESTIGCVDERYIMGKVLFRILPINKFGTIK
ncbi:MAG: signal peptidase I [Oscillospiraceae bacterium]